jgi:hypothetical protein
MMSKEQLPTEEHFRKLSRRGLVAFAARCVRRVEALPAYQEAHHNIAQTIEALWQFPRDLSDEPDIDRHYAELQPYRSQVGLPVVVIACETALQALSEAGGDAPGWACDLAAATDKAAKEEGHDISRLVRHDFKALFELAPGPFPELGEPFDEIEVEVKSPLWPDGREPPWLRQA